MECEPEGDDGQVQATLKQMSDDELGGIAILIRSLQARAEILDREPDA